MPLYDQYLGGVADPFAAGAIGPAPKRNRQEYDAVQNKGRRKAPVARTLSEDDELKSHERRILSTGTRDLQRNFEIAAWAIRKHLDYVSTFHFQARTGDDKFDDDLEEWVRWWSKPENCDAARRFSLPGMVRMSEARATVDGDVLLSMRKDAKLQMIEGDRVQTLGDFPLGKKLSVNLERLINGVEINVDGAAVRYAICKRKRGGGMEFEKFLSAEFVHQHGYFDRYDQVRGISPLAPAINRLRDVYEGFDYALAKAKVSQLFALAFYRAGIESVGDLAPEAGAATGDDDGDDESRYSVDFGRGPVQLDLDPGDRAEFLESRTPSSEFQAFSEVMILVALKALDIPFSFYNESFTNWVGQRQANVQYEMGAANKQRNLVYMLQRLTRWRLGLAVLDGQLKLPAKIPLDKVRYEWVPAGIPWIDPQKEIAGEISAIGAGLSDPIEACRAKGKNFFDVIDRRAEAEAYAKSKTVALSFVAPELPPEEKEETGKKKDSVKNNQANGKRTALMF